MNRYVLQRVALAIPTLFLVTVLVFSILRLVAGDVLYLMISEQQYAKDMDDLRHKLGLDRPMHEQYIQWVGDAVRGDLGQSLFTTMPVRDELLKRLPVSAELGVLAILVSLIVAVPIGVISAVRQDTFWDYVTRGLAMALLSIPNFFLATLVILIPSLLWRWAPNTSFIPFFEDPLENLQQFIIPAILLGGAMSASVMRMTRAMMLEVLRQDYIRTAWAKGLRERAVIYRHALKNALIPVVTMVGMQLGTIVGGAVVIEQIFALPGVGRFMITAVTMRDYPIVQAINLVLAFFVVFVNIVVDLAYSYLDPRIRYR